MLPYKVKYITNPHKILGRSMNPKYLTIHSTGNPKSSAQNERDWLNNRTNKSSTGFHLVVDDKQAIKCLPFNQVAYHAGDGRNGTGNTKSIGLEICESGDREKTLDNAVNLIVKILKEKGWSTSNLRRHHDWSGKICPRILYDGGSWSGWKKLKARVEELMKEKEVLKKEMDSIEVRYKPNSRVTYVNGEKKLLDKPVPIDSGVTFLPARFFAESFGIDVSYNASTQEVVMTLKGSSGTSSPSKPSVKPTPRPIPKKNAYIKDDLIIKESPIEDIYLLGKNTTTAREPAFDGCNGCFFWWNTTTKKYEILSIAYDRGKLYSNRDFYRNPRACLIAYKNGKMKVESIPDFTKRSDKEEILWAIGGLSSDKKTRIFEQASAGGIPEGVKRPRTMIGFKDNVVYQLVTRSQNYTLEEIEYKMSKLGFKKDEWIFLDGGGSTQCYYYNGGKPLYKNSSRIVPLLVGVRR